MGADPGRGDDADPAPMVLAVTRSARACAIASCASARVAGCRGAAGTGVNGSEERPSDDDEIDGVTRGVVRVGGGAVISMAEEE